MRMRCTANICVTLHQRGDSSWGEHVSPEQMQFSHILKDCCNDAVDGVLSHIVVHVE